jgi:hypothetical protein
MDAVRRLAMSFTSSKNDVRNEMNEGKKAMKGSRGGRNENREAAEAPKTYKAHRQGEDNRDEFKMEHKSRTNAMPACENKLLTILAL